MIKSSSHTAKPVVIEIEKKEKQPSPAKKDKKRDLSPSVAAMFEAVSASQQSSSDVVSDDTDTPEEGPSAALKSMLNIQGIAKCMYMYYSGCT